MPEITVDARGMACPGPISALTRACRNAQNGDVIVVLATDPGFEPDVKAWVEKTGNKLLELRKEGGTIIVKIEVVAKK